MPRAAVALTTPPHAAQSRRARTARVRHVLRRGAAAYGDDNTFLLGAKTLERAPLRVSCLVATTFFTQLFAYVTLVPLNHDEPLVLRTKRAYPLLVGRTLRRLHGVPQH